MSKVNSSQEGNKIPCTDSNRHEISDSKSLTFRERRLSLSHVTAEGAEHGEVQCGFAKNLLPEVLVTASCNDQNHNLADNEKPIKYIQSSNGDDGDNHDESTEIENSEVKCSREIHEPDYEYDFVDDTTNLRQYNMNECDNHSYHSMHSSEADEKAHTFRIRRLSMTTTSSSNSHKATTSHSQSVASEHCLEKKRQRRLSQDSSVCSTNSISSDVTNHAFGVSVSTALSLGKTPLQFISRTMHADELIRHDGMPPPSPAAYPESMFHNQHRSLDNQESVITLPSGSASSSTSNTNNVPSATLPSTIHRSQLVKPSTASGLTLLQPKWKRRKTLCHQTELHKLPFAADVVGIYSCHGVEPVYDSDFDDEDDYDDVGHSGDVQLTMTAKINQDRGGVAYPYANHPKTALFAVYDGHGQGGELVSQYALYEVQRRLEKHPKFHTDLSTALKETFVAVDEALQQEPLIEPLFSGTTACVVVYQDNRLTLANAGDSRAVCARRVLREARCNQSFQNPNLHCESFDFAKIKTDVKDMEFKYEAINLTEDQNPDVPSEMERILRMGGYVSLPPAPGLSARVWLDPQCSQIGLAMSRSIGDHAIAPAGVIAEPVISAHDVCSDDEFLIIASDGVWEFIDSTQAVQIIVNNIQHGATKACQALIEAAAARWHEEEGAYRDDITAIVIQLNMLW